MSLDATLQVRMDSQMKESVEELYRNLGTSFAEAVRIFAQQSLLAGGMPFQPRLKTLEEMTEEDIDRQLTASKADILAGRVFTQEEVLELIKRKFQRG